MGSTITLNHNDVYQKNNGNKSLKTWFPIQKSCTSGSSNLKSCAQPANHGSEKLHSLLWNLCRIKVSPCCLQDRAVEQLDCGTTSFSHHPLDQRLFWNTKHSIRNKNFSNAGKQAQHQLQNWRFYRNSKHSHAYSHWVSCDQGCWLWQLILQSFPYFLQNSFRVLHMVRGYKHKLKWIISPKTSFWPFIPSVFSFQTTYAGTRCVRKK